MNMRFLPITLAISAAFAGSAQAQSLMSLYETARGYDAAYKAAQSQYTANLSKGDQAKALLLPTIGLSANVNKTEVELLAAAQTVTSQSKAATLSASQPLYRPANFATYQQGMRQLELASVQLKAAEQDLMVRLSQAYFDVLVSRESLDFVKAQKVAVAEQLAAAKRNFEVGTSTITDTREAQARYDLVLAQEIAADNDLRIKRLALNQLVGLNNIEPKSLSSKAKLSGPDAQSLEQWVQQSAEQNPSVIQSRAALEIAKLETSKAEAGHKPTLDLVAGYTPTRYKNGKGINTSQVDTNTNSVTLSFNMPLFAGFATQNRIKETVALEDKARSDLEAAERNVAQATRSAFFGLQSGLGQVNALQAAEASSQSALDANKLGYQVGVRINIDVLNSQSQLFQTKRDLAKARYDVLLGQLKLRQAAGTLTEADLASINALLNP
ncbi:TolC family outer membrane protein [Limnohabitans sp. 103DPR2]|uniref:TolC family outer membrane protein n=1 Tax=Limnohabitans sp. 103DPR2 TaxID=1678129 RepID=UPI0006DBE678|nr:TolC family outer membrane protein [Limnohabitans sp. 103DPR2]ALK91692.1 Outer membrane protein TolC precursor [Limnohabitans sp. 103DPR2]